MIPLTLPSEDRRTIVRSFWLVFSLAFGTVVWLVGWKLYLRLALPLGLMGGLVSGLLVFVREKFVRRLYHAWNRRLVSPFNSVASRAVMGICFFLIFLATGRSGSRLSFDTKAGTTWTRRSSLPANAYELPYAREGSTAGTGWIQAYLQWTVRSGNAWAISLIPFLWFLRLLADDEHKAVEANIYTLF